MMLRSSRGMIDERSPTVYSHVTMPSFVPTTNPTTFDEERDG